MCQKDSVVDRRFFFFFFQININTVIMKWVSKENKLSLEKDKKTKQSFRK